MNSHSHLDYLLKGSAWNLQALGFLDSFVDGADHVERLLRQVIILTVQNAVETTDGFLQGHVFTRRTGEYFRNEERLRQEALDLTRTGYGLLVFFRQFVHTQNRDDVLQLLVTLQGLLNATCDVVVFLTDNQRIQLTRGGVQRVDRRVDTQLRDLTRQYYSRIKVGEGGCRRRVGQVIRRYVYRLDRRNGTSLGRGDTFLQNAHLFRQSRLVTYRRRHTTQQCRYFGTRQGVTVDVVDEQQYVTAFITEFLRHGQTGQGYTQTVAGRLVHLAVDHRYLGLVELLNVYNAGFLHLVVEVVTLTGTLTYARKYGQTGVLSRDVVDQLHHVYGFTYTGTTEQTDLATLGKRAHQVDNLDAGFQQLVGRCLIRVGRSLTVDRVTFFFTDRTTLVDRVTQNVHDATQSCRTNGYGNRCTGIGRFQSTAQTFGLTHGNCTHDTIAQLLLNFQCQAGFSDGQCVVNLGHAVTREFHVNYRTNNLNNTSATHVRILINF